MARRDQIAPDLVMAQQRNAEARHYTRLKQIYQVSWRTMAIPNMWEDGGLSDFDGLVWFRRHLNIPAAWAGKDLIVKAHCPATSYSWPLSAMATRVTYPCCGKLRTGCRPSWRTWRSMMWATWPTSIPVTNARWV